MWDIKVVSILNLFLAFLGQWILDLMNLSASKVFLLFVLSHT